MTEWDYAIVTLANRIEVNPSRPLKRGHETIHVEMAAVNPDQRNVSELGFRLYKGSGSRFRNGDTLFARITPCLENGKTAFINNLPSDAYVAHGSTEFIVLSGVEGVSDNLFVYYLARHPEFRNYAIQNMTGTSGRQRVNADSLARYTLTLPPLPEQKAIAHILGALDDKIELNRQMNETLEAMARAIFKSWFVDFDPVRAKMNGEDYPLDAATLALFPDRFVDSALGEIPAGWEVGRLGDDFAITMGQSPPGSTYNEDGDGLPFFQGTRDFGFRFPARRVFCTQPKRFAKAGDTLVSVRAPVGDVNMADEECCVGRGVAAVRHRTGSRSYTLYAMRSLRTIFDRFEAEGTVFGSLNKKDFHGLDFVIPSRLLVQGFEHFCCPIDQKIENNEHESRTLAELRDTLLPKLISGELRVPQGVGMVEEMA